MACRGKKCAACLPPPIARRAQAGLDDAFAVHHPPQLQIAPLCTLGSVHDIDVFAALVGEHCLVVNQYGGDRAALLHLHPRKHARLEQPLVVVQRGAQCQRARLRIQPVVGEAHAARVRKAFIADQADTHHRIARGRAAVLHATQQALLIGIEMHIHRILRNHGHQDTVVRARKVAGGQQRASGYASNGGTDFGEAQIQLGGCHRSFGSRYLGSGLGQRSSAVIGFFSSDGAVRHQVACTPVLRGSQFRRCFGTLQLCLCARQRGPVGAGIDAEQQLAFAHGLPLAEMDMFDVACHAGADFHGFLRSNPAVELVPQLYRLSAYRGSRDGGWRWFARRTAVLWWLWGSTGCECGGQCKG